MMMRNHFWCRIQRSALTARAPRRRACGELLGRHERARTHAAEHWHCLNDRIQQFARHHRNVCIFGHDAPAYHTDCSICMGAMYIWALAAVAYGDLASSKNGQLSAPAAQEGNLSKGGKRFVFVI